MQKKIILELKGTVDRVIYRNEQNGYSIIEVDAGQGVVTATGTMPCVSVGEGLCLRGDFKNHATFGPQFSVQSCERSMPTTCAAILKYLSAGAIKGIGRATAEKLVTAFGDMTLQIIENEPARLTEVSGITGPKARKIEEEYKKIFGMRELMLYLDKYKVSAEEAVRVWSVLGRQAIETIQQDPYIICGERMDISFEKADDIAMSLKKATDDIYRVRAGIGHILQHNVDNGHTCLPRDRLVPAAAGYLEVSHERVDEILQETIDEGVLQNDEIDNREFIFINKMHQAEVCSAGRLLLLRRFPPKKLTGYKTYTEWVEENENIHYASQQKEAIAKAMEKGMLVLTGGPGTGKTTTLNGIIRVLEHNGEKVYLAAPTGRAAHRMSTVTGREAKTIHRLLEVDWDAQDNCVFKKNEQNLLDCDALVIDELSMVDSKLFDSVLRALPMGCRLILVGDSDQLPSVGAGNVLADLINSGMVPVVRLTEVFRQSQKSLIVTNAHRIVKGEMPLLNQKKSDFFFIEIRDPVEISQTICDLCKRRLPVRYGYSPLFDIQVITPGRKGELGTSNINKLLQDELNPPAQGKQEINHNGVTFREGDKVMQVRNNYNIIFEKANGTTGEGVFNGDIGILLEVNKVDASAVVQFDERQARYEAEDLNDLELAYAVTVHKSQGSEFEAVIMPMYYGAPQLYYRNLLYTGVTRARSILVMVGMPDIVAKMVENNKKTRRYSALRNFLVRGSENE